MTYVRTVLAATTSLALATGGAAAGAAGVPDGRWGVDCAWPVMSTPEQFNVFWPDTNATYWVQPYIIGDDTTVTLRGTYPDVRYASFVVYDGFENGGGSFQANGVDSWITDYEIVADEGSVNPFATAGEPGGHFTVTLSDDARPGDRNTIPLSSDEAEAGDTGLLIYRVYVPDGGDASQVPLPSVTITDAGSSTTLPGCTARGGVQDLPAEVQQYLSPGDDPAVRSRERAAQDVSFERIDYSSLLPNPDSGYLISEWTPKRDEVMVVRGKAPSHIAGRSPAPWPRDGIDVRYWSMCSGLTDFKLSTVVNEDADGNALYGCAYDDETALDADGFYTYVIGPESTRPQISGTDGLTFLPTSQRTPRTEHVLIIRNMVPVDGFAESILQVPYGSGAAAAADIMGDYYPVSGVCSISTLTGNGAEACLS
ncbi:MULTISPECIES: hypothetical protein [Catenuloplanes]|uniref:Secreted protein n=1 Tax=Catenuloplanes niger TaxID=587534 RepID=A0AAE3ZY30_9ACTN|nr:hypothetical protein [Catenuloplanes niger]MDR7325920.1 hypothetical protein [Catenuloplanes niger]